MPRKHPRQTDQSGFGAGLRDLQDELRDRWRRRPVRDPWPDREQAQDGSTSTGAEEERRGRAEQDR